jgi:hypothetical protein
LPDRIDMVNEAQIRIEGCLIAPYSLCEQGK